MTTATTPALPAFQTIAERDECLDAIARANRLAAPTSFDVEAEYVYEHYLPMMFWAGCSLSEMVQEFQHITQFACTFGYYPTRWRCQ